MASIRIKRIYEPAAPSDSFRVLVDRVWPRGVSKEKAAIDEWARDLAPSTDLRKWFGHDPERWETFRSRYREELRHSTQALEALEALRARRGRVTLVYSAKDEEHNQAVVLREWLAS